MERIEMERLRLSVVKKVRGRLRRRGGFGEGGVVGEAVEPL